MFVCWSWSGEIAPTRRAKLSPLIRLCLDVRSLASACSRPEVRCETRVRPKKATRAISCSSRRFWGRFRTRWARQHKCTISGDARCRLQDESTLEPSALVLVSDSLEPASFWLQPEARPDKLRKASSLKLASQKTNSTRQLRGRRTRRSQTNERAR